MLVELTEGEIIFIREASREFRTVAPDHIKADARKLSRWLETRELYDPERISVDLKMTSILASI